jgi:hypothetical protein
MVRLRLAALAILMALTAPWLAPCVASAPAGQPQMPCCKAAAGGGPVVRPCCTPADRQPLAPAQTAANTAAASAAVAIVPVPVPAFVPRVHVPAAPIVLRQLQLRSTILLI